MRKVVYDGICNMYMFVYVYMHVYIHRSYIYIYIDIILYNNVYIYDII